MWSVHAKQLEDETSLLTPLKVHVINFFPFVPFHTTSIHDLRMKWSMAQLGLIDFLFTSLHQYCTWRSPQSPEGLLQLIWTISTCFYRFPQLHSITVSGRYKNSCIEFTTFFAFWLRLHGQVNSDHSIAIVLHLPKGTYLVFVYQQAGLKPWTGAQPWLVLPEGFLCLISTHKVSLPLSKCTQPQTANTAATYTPQMMHCTFTLWRQGWKPIRSLFFDPH